MRRSSVSHGHRRILIRRSMKNTGHACTRSVRRGGSESALDHAVTMVRADAQIIGFPWASADSDPPLHERLLRLDQTGNASPEFKGRCIGSNMKHDFLTPWRCKPELTFSAGEAVNLPALADTQFVFCGAKLP